VSVRVAVLAGPDPARAFPAAALALGLADNGDDVLMLTGRRWLDRLQQVGVAAEEMPGLTGDPGSTAELGYRTPRQAAAMSPAIRDRLADWRPDLVVADVRMPAGGFAAEMLDLRWAQLHPHPLTLSANPTLLEGNRGRRRVQPRDPQPRTRPNRHAQRDLADVRDLLGLAPVGPGPLLHMVATLPVLEPARPNWPRNASLVGPLTWDPAADDLPIPEGQAPLVLVSPSMAARDRAELLEAALAGLRGVRLVGTVLEQYGGKVPWWASVGRGRQEPLLAEAAVVVTGGGHGMIVRALTAGVPLVLVPGSGDVELARRAERLGAAVLLRRLSPRSLRRAVDRVVDDRAYASAARQVAHTVASADPVVLCHQTLVGRSVF
jgi:UDP:flavonoid glycosyltransferase YjiC (YdhE family)